MPASPKASVLVFFAAGVPPETVRGATFLEKGCHFTVVVSDTSASAVAAETQLRRGLVE